MLKLNIIAITIGSYPEGEATTNRNISLLKGLAEQGNNVELLVLSPTDKVVAGQRLKKGAIGGFTYKYTSHSVFWPKSFFLKILILLFSTIKALRILYNKKKAAEIDIIFMLLSKPLLLHPFLIFAKYHKLKIFHEQTETPELLLEYKSITGRLAFQYYLFLIRKFTGISVISSYLKTFFSNIIDEKRICIINMTVDYQRFLKVNSSPFPFKYIAYCGTMYGNKDGLFDLISAFNLIISRIDVKLVLIGDIVDERAKYVKNLIDQKKLNEYIILTGSIISSEIPKYLQNAEMLLLSRPKNIQAQGGFPTKLGEYLLTGKPTIVTKVGDIPKFLQDGINSFLVEPGDPALFANKILYVYNNYNTSLLVAKEGKLVAMTKFNYQIEAKKLASFFHSVTLQ